MAPRVGAYNRWLGIDEEDILGGVPRRADFLQFKDVMSKLDTVGVHGFSPSNPIFARNARTLLGQVPTFQLLKLHGSLTWYWVSDDPSGYTLQRWRLPGPYGQPEAWDGDELQRGLPGTEPFIVPPAALKSEQLRNTVIRDIWRRAKVALSHAERVALVGYSLPAADRSFGEMISEGLRGRDVVVEVVNPEPGPVVHQLKRLGVRQLAPPISGRHCVRTWVERERDRLAGVALADLAEGDLDDHDMLYVAANPARAVVKVVKSRGPSKDVVLSLYVPPPGGQVAEPLRLGELRSLLKDAQRLVVSQGKRKAVVVRFEQSGPPNRAAGLGMIYLVLAGIIQDGRIGLHRANVNDRSTDRA